MERQEELRSRLRELGFDVVRFVRVDEPNPAMGRALTAWLEAGFQADMEWMTRTAEKRSNPGLVLPGARSAVLLGVNYWTTQPPGAAAKWARYSLYQDYHDTLKPALAAAGKLLEEFYGARSEDYRYYVDAGPVLERGWAERGGLGFVGKNAMLISPEFGNWLFLAEILTRIAFAPDERLAPTRGPGEEPPAKSSRVGLYCGSCTRCMDACPTNAIREPGVVDARRCISYQTIENRGIIPRELRAGIGARIYGCDICLEVCPWNRFAQEGRRALLSARGEIADLTLLEILSLTPERFAEVFRKTPIKRTKLTGLLRNACIVAANTNAAECLDRILELAASHESAVVRATAVWAAARLSGWEKISAQLVSARRKESDALVLSEYLQEEAVG